MTTKFPDNQISSKLRELGAKDVLVKFLAPNDNGKNQIYLAGDISALGLLPTGEIEFNQSTSQKPGADSRGPIFRAALNLWWMSEDGNLINAPHAKLILYPQYSEVRLSGFVRSCSAAPAHLFDINKRGREPGRVLVLAPLPDGKVVAALFPSDTEEARSIAEAGGEPYGVMRHYTLDPTVAGITSEQLLIHELLRIHKLGWLDPVYLERDGSFRECKGTNCGGVTLESHLGIMANGFSEPDFHGWEVKQHSVGSWAKPSVSRITLMTPEPSGGAYVDEGPEWFIRKWGYADKRGRDDRINFGGVYRVGGEPHKDTGLRMLLDGYDDSTGEFRGDGAVLLIDNKDRVAASWSFSKLIDHWKRKHSKAAYIPSISIKSPSIKYQYGANICLAEGARFSFLLRAFANRVVYYDPGIKLEQASTDFPKQKRRSQFRVDSKSLVTLYESYRLVNLNGR